ncbi:MAG: hypothetical protein HZA59_03595 [Hydrogenophilales bacterium]|nr:hypothetical protein [Hydrogenophilales bacterium]
MNLGVGFTIPTEHLHQDKYFPSFTQLPKPAIPSIASGAGPVFMDSVIALGGFPGATDAWAKLKKALRFHRNKQCQLRDVQITLMFEGWGQSDHSIENAFYMFLARFLGGKPEPILGPLVEQLKNARNANRTEFSRFMAEYDVDLKAERFAAYSEIIGEYFHCYEEFNQTAVYARLGIPLPPESIATSSAFESTRMFYGNAYEVLGMHLDVVAAVNNMCSGRDYDQMQAMDLKQYRTIKKSNRTKCFSSNSELSWFVEEYDSQVRNASHHRWFKIDDAKRVILYRSGGTGALHKMSYAEYLYRCNRLFFRICAMACWEIIMLHMTNQKL